MLQRDLSAAGGGLAQIGTRRETEPEGEVVPELPSDEVVGQYEDEGGVRLLMFTRDAGTPVVANFGYQPTKVFEKNLRHSAKIRGLRLHFYRLMGGYIAIEVEPRGARFSRRLGIRDAEAEGSEPQHRARRFYAKFFER
jgi:hypothetical protein